MKMTEVVMVRVYITEDSNLLPRIINYLYKEVKIRGASVFRAIEGFGDTGIHTSSLLDLAFNLPIVIEFFDYQDKVNAAIEYLHDVLKVEHIITWKASANIV